MYLIKQSYHQLQDVLDVGLATQELIHIMHNMDKMHNVKRIIFWISTERVANLRGWSTVRNVISFWKGLFKK